MKIPEIQLIDCQELLLFHVRNYFDCILGQNHFFSRPSTQFVWLTGLSSGFDLVENNKWLASFFLFNKNEELQSWKKRFFFDWELKEFSSSSFIHDKTIFITNHHPTRKKNFKQSASLERNEKIRKKN